jgi:hypothetical protein
MAQGREIRSLDDESQVSKAETLNNMSCLHRKPNQYCEGGGQHEISNAVVAGASRGLAPETVRED